VIEQPFHRTADVGLVNPRNELLPSGHAAAEAHLCQTTQHRQDAIPSAPQHHRGTQCHLSRVGRAGFLERSFPGTGDFHREFVLGFRRGADFTGHLIHRTVERVSVNRGGARIQPYTRRFGALPDGIAEHPRGLDSRFENYPPVTRVIPTIDGTAGEVDHRIRTVDLAAPRTE
jgi:hypothetical protein